MYAIILKYTMDEHHISQMKLLAWGSQAPEAKTNASVSHLWCLFSCSKWASWIKHKSLTLSNKEPDILNLVEWNTVWNLWTEKVLKNPRQHKNAV